MNKYIEREKAKEYLHEACARLGGNGGLMLKIRFSEEPDADVKPVVRGNWIQTWEEDDAEPMVLWRCDSCKTVERKPTNFCPNCGADMGGITSAVSY